MQTNTYTAQSAMSETNRSRILTYLYQNGISSRATIAQTLGLTPAAVTKITARLIAEGFIEETGDIEGRKNRRSIGLQIDTSKFHVIGAKFARTIVEIGVFDLAGNRLEFCELPPVHADTISDTLNNVHAQIQSFLEHDAAIIAIGMAVPGPYLRNNGSIASVSSMPQWQQVNFIEEFHNAFRVPVYMEQDARSGALAQHIFDKPEHEQTLAYYLLGEGIGLGVLDHGKLVDGAQGVATELGHTSIDPVHGIPCQCGNIGCLERYCSAITIHERMIKQSDALQIHAAEMTHKQACAALFEAANQGNTAAQALLDEIARYIGYGCVSICNLYNPSHIVLGDILAQAGPRLLEIVKETARERVLPIIFNHTTITLSTLPTDAATLGAAAVAINAILAQPSDFVT